MGESQIPIWRRVAADNSLRTQAVIFPPVGVTRQRTATVKFRFVELFEITNAPTVGEAHDPPAAAANLYFVGTNRKCNDNNCHCKERSDVAISIKVFRIRLNTQKNEGKNAEFN